MALFTTVIPLHRVFFEQSCSGDSLQHLATSHHTSGRMGKTCHIQNEHWSSLLIAVWKYEVLHLSSPSIWISPICTSGIFYMPHCNKKETQKNCSLCIWVEIRATYRILFPKLDISNFELHSSRAAAARNSEDWHRVKSDDDDPAVPIVL